MTKDGPDFPDRLLVAGRFDGYEHRITLKGKRKRSITTRLPKKINI